MNYLAHLYLADSTPESILGNLLADFVKGKDVQLLPAGIQRGIRMHRQVDSFTDRNPIVQRSITRISAKWGWFSGILIDVYYDHIFALNWNDYCGEPLRRFTSRINHCLRDNLPIVPQQFRELVGRMIESDRLFTYSTLEGIADTLLRLSARIRERIPRRNIGLESAMPDLQANHEALGKDFHDFFPQLIAFVGEWKQQPEPEPITTGRV
jgi:acyl carrier protein phosphodiesterase